MTDAECAPGADPTKPSAPTAVTAETLWCEQIAFRFSRERCSMSTPVSFPQRCVHPVQARPSSHFRNVQLPLPTQAAAAHQSRCAQQTATGLISPQVPPARNEIHNPRKASSYRLVLPLLRHLLVVAVALSRLHNHEDCCAGTARLACPYRDCVRYAFRCQILWQLILCLQCGRRCNV